MKKIFMMAALTLFPIFAVAQGQGAHRSSNTDTGSCPDSNHPHMIDLGLPSGTKWACCNVGSSKPEDYGKMFAWGETSAKDTYDESTYRWYNGSSSAMVKYNNDSSRGTVDNKTRLDMDDDAARANWQGSWRMPTIAELEELKANCTYTWTTVNGIKGGKFTSRSNGRSIFLPAAGWRYGVTRRSRGENGNCWSSSLDESNPVSARYFSFSPDGADTDSDDRYDGMSVRPVLGR